MYIKLTKIDYDAELGGYDAVEVFGKKLEDGETWSKAFFSNNKDLRNQLDDFTVGEEINVVLENNPKNKKWWNIIGFKEMTDQDRENLENPTNRGSGKSKSGSGGGRKGKGSGLTKEEWAEKDRATKLSIAKAVAMKIANENSKINTGARALIAFANEILPYLLDTAKTDTVKTEPDGDPLDPPI